MHWQDANDFFSMGGRGGYVWGAYGAMALLMLAETLLARWRLRSARRAIAQRVADEAEVSAAGSATAASTGVGARQ